MPELRAEDAELVATSSALRLCERVGMRQAHRHGNGRRCV